MWNLSEVFGIIINISALVAERTILYILNILRLTMTRGSINLHDVTVANFVQHFLLSCIPVRVGVSAN